MNIPFITQQVIEKHIRIGDVVAALEATLLAEVDPQSDVPRNFYKLDDARRLLFMASQNSEWVGAKVMSVNDGNHARRVDRAQGVYLLMDKLTTTPKAIIAGDALTELRTAAMTCLVTSRLLPREASRAVMYGYGAQARKHIDVLRQLHPSLRDLVVSGRNATRVEMFAANAAEAGWNARIGQAMPPVTAIPRADLIITATGAGEPLFDGSLVEPGTLVVALGTHSPDRRELDSELIRRSNVVVEDVDTALAEAGEVAMAIDEGVLSPDQLITLRDVIRGKAELDHAKPTVYKSVGMPWQDLTVAGHIYAELPPTALR